MARFAPVTSSLRSQVLIRAQVIGDVLASEVLLADTPLCQREGRLAPEIGQVWQSLEATPQVAGERLLSAGRLLAKAVFDDMTHRLVADLIARLQPGNWVDIVFVGEGVALGLPIELLRLTASNGQELGPLALIAGVTVRRQLRGAPVPASGPLAGPVKILAAVAAPEETYTANAPLNVETEMQAVLDAVSDLSGDRAGQVQILEVASLSQIAAALRQDSYHVLHLSAHGSPDAVELEDEDGRPHQVTSDDLIGTLRDAGAPVPLIVLSSCSGGAATANAMAAGLVRAGADRVVAMQASVTDAYATALTSALYRELARSPDQPVATALARARRQAENHPGEQDNARRPEFGLATLLAAGEDPPLIDTSCPRVLLTSTQILPSGTSVRELSLGQLIGRRRQLREATAALRRTPAARDEHGAIAGVQLLGIGGIGKTAIAGRLITRLRGDGMRVAVHEGRWNPTALFVAIAHALSTVETLRPTAEALVSPAIEDARKVHYVRELLATVPLLLVFDDFEQNLVPGGVAFTDPAFDDLITDWCEAAEVGAILLTCRYPLPVDDRYLVRIPVPPMSPAELRRLFLRLPALRGMPAQDQRLLTRVIGGHPRLIEYVDALVRGKPAQIKSVQAKLRALARSERVDLRRPRALDTAINDSLLLGSADILLHELLGLLTDHERTVLDQLSISRAPMTLEDLAYTLDPLLDTAPPPTLDSLQSEVEHLTDLTLLAPGPDILVHP